MASRTTTTSSGDASDTKPVALASTTTPDAAAPTTLMVTTTVSDLMGGLRVESETTSIAGLPVSLIVERAFEGTHLDSLSSLTVGLKVSNKSTLWSARANVEIKLFLKEDRQMSETVEKVLNWQTPVEQSMVEWEELIDPSNNLIPIDECIAVTAKIILTDVTGLRKRKIMDDYSCAFPKSNIALLVEGKQLYSIRQMLAYRSSFFSRLFESHPEKDQYALNCKFEDMRNLLSIVFADGKKTLTDETVEGVLTVATNFEFPTIIAKCEEFLTTESGFSLAKKLWLSDQFSLSELQEESFKEINTSSTVRELAATREFKNLSQSVQLAVMSMLLHSEAETSWEESSEESDEESTDEGSIDEEEIDGLLADAKKENVFESDI